MVNESFYLEIMNLIASKTEGQYWDFKREPHKNNESLVHDILCLANTKHDGDRFLIIGVADSSKNCEIIGLDENTPKRKKEAELNDCLNSKEFGGGNVPIVNVRTLNIDNKEIDIIIIKNDTQKPYYLEKNYGDVKAYHIYTRTGDRNTPKDKNANFADIEYMWKERFGLNLDVGERFEFYLDDIDNWIDEFETKETALYKPVPEFSIELTEFNESDYVEPFNTFYLDNSLLYGNILFKYNSNVIFQCEYAYCDGGRLLIPVPKLHSYIDKNGEKIYFYYYNLDAIEGKFAKLISKDSFEFRCRIRSFPFIVVKNETILNKFVEYLKENITKSDIPSNIMFNTGDPNKYTSSVNLDSLVYIESIFDEWKSDYEKV